MQSLGDSWRLDDLIQKYTKGYMECKRSLESLVNEEEVL